MSKELQAVMVSFAVFFAGILMFAAGWPFLTQGVADERLIMLIVFGYLLLLRMGGRWLARRICKRV